MGYLARKRNCSVTVSPAPIASKYRTACPGAERRVALLRIGAAIVAIVDVEDALVRGAPAYVVGIAALAVPDGIPGGGAGVLRDAVDQRNLLVVLAHQHMP